VKILFSILAFSFSIQVHAAGDSKKYALTLYAEQLNGDAPRTLKAATEFLHAEGYQSTILSDASVGLPSPALPPTPNNFEKATADLVVNVKKGDQVLLNIMTHGSQTDSGGNSHSLHLKGGDISLERMRLLTRELEAKGATVAVIDQSCYSGASISLSSEGTCVVSAASDQEPAWATFSSDFWSEVKAGRTVEETFLPTRAKHQWYASPMISTPEGVNTSRAFRFFVGFMAKGESKNVYHFVGQEAIDCSQGGPEAISIPVTELAGHVADVATHVLEKEEVRQLDQAIKEYGRWSVRQKKKDVSRDVINALATQTIAVEEQEIDLLNLALGNFERTLGDAERVLATPGIQAETAVYWEAEKKRAELLIAKRDELIQSNPDFAAVVASDFNSSNHEFAQMHNSFAKLPIAAKERPVYTMLYDSYSKMNLSKDGPCRRFKF